jgi:hypothetical protein
MILLEFDLPGGRRVELTQLHLLGTWDWYSQTPEDAEKNWRDLLVRFFGRSDFPIIVRPGVETSSPPPLCGLLTNPGMTILFSSFVGLQGRNSHQSANW